MDQSLPTRDIVVIGGSAGALEPLRTILSRLPGDLPAAVFVTLHITENSTLTSLLGRAANMPVHWASDKASFARGHIYVAPADHHLLLLSFGMRLSRGPRENRCRPAIDVLFRSAAASYGPRVIGVLLSGYQADGVAGLVAIKELGGKVIVQDPSEAEVPDMPQQASQAVSIDQSGTAAEIAMLLSHYVAQPAEAMVGDRSKYEIELAVAQGGSARRGCAPWRTRRRSPVRTATACCRRLRAHGRCASAARSVTRSRPSGCWRTSRIRCAAPCAPRCG